MRIDGVKKIDKTFFADRFPRRLLRAERFVFEEDRLRSLAAGYLLWKILGITEKDLKTGEYGKPYAPNMPEFSLSHSGDFTVLAVSDRPIGVDIEKTGCGDSDIAELVFTPEEVAYFRIDPECHFGILWTLKEAAVKATGKGMETDLKRFSVLPLTEGGRITLDGTALYGKTVLRDGYALSVVSETNEEPVFRRVFS